MDSSQQYSAFGLRINSEVALPELYPAGPAGEPDVRIRLASLPADRPTASGIHFDDGGTLLVVENVASFLVSNGREIAVHPWEAVPIANVRLYLLGSAMGVLLHQRGLLPLHANAIEIGHSAAAFMGASGAGKSTLAAWFHDRGCRIVADDVSVVTFDAAKRPLVHPGIPRLRLWKEALEAGGRTPDEHPLSWQGDPTYLKYDVSIMQERASRSALPLAALYLLATGENFGIEPLGGVEAADAIFANTYRGGYVPLADGSRSHWLASLQLVRSIPLFRVTRRWGLNLLDEEGGRIRTHLDDLIGSPESRLEGRA